MRACAGCHCSPRRAGSGRRSSAAASCFDKCSSAVAYCRADRTFASAFLRGLWMLLDEVKAVVGSALQLGDRVRNMNESSALLGAVPELDSIAVVNVITALEERFDIIVADDEIGAAAFETLG